VDRKFCESRFFSNIVKEIEKIIVKDLDKTICKISRRGAKAASNVNHGGEEVRINFLIEFGKIITRLIVVFKNRVVEFLITGGGGALFTRVLKKITLL